MATADNSYKPNCFDIFIEGCRKGLLVCANYLLPNVLMAFTLTQILTLLHVMDALGMIFGPIMGIFGLPGEAVLVLCATWLSCGAGVGVAASLVHAGTLTGAHVTIMAPALILMASQIQYMGRLLGVADVPKRYWPALMVNCVLCAFIGMILMRMWM